MKWLTILWAVLKFLYGKLETERSDREPSCNIPALLYGSIFGSFLPNPTNITSKRWKHTRDLLKYKKTNYISWSTCLKLGTDDLNRIGYTKVFKIIWECCKTIPGVKSIKFVNTDKLRNTKRRFSRATGFICKTKNLGSVTVEISDTLHDTNLFVGLYTFRVYSTNSQWEAVVQLQERITTRLYEEHKRLCPLLVAGASAARELVQRINNISQLAGKLKTFRWVILVHGSPGTGKTWLFKHLQFFVDPNIQLVHTRDLQESLQGAYKDLTRDSESSEPTAETEKVNLYDNSFKRVQEIIHIPYEIIDEVDRLLGSYTYSKSSYVDKYQSEMISIFKEKLEESTGLIVLITNHKDRLDASAIRDGRINEVIEIGQDFYSVSEKRNIAKYYEEYYGIKPYVSAVTDKALLDLTIAEIEAKTKRRMLEEGFTEINKQIENEK